MVFVSRNFLGEKAYGFHSGLFGEGEVEDSDAEFGW